MKKKDLRGMSEDAVLDATRKLGNNNNQEKRVMRLQKNKNFLSWLWEIFLLVAAPRGGAE